MLADRLRMTSKVALAGQQAYTTAGTYTFTVPSGVTSICVLCVGGGSGGGVTNIGNSAGGLSYSNSISVTSGESLTVVVGAGGAAGVGGLNTYTDGGTGGSSTIARSSTVLVRGLGGHSGEASVGSVIYTGGYGNLWTDGGGGAAGYQANGGNGGAGYNNAGTPQNGGNGTAGSAGGGGGGGVDPNFFSGRIDNGQLFGGGGGGGIGLLGTGSSGTGGAAGSLGGGSGGDGGSSGTSGGSASGDGGNGGLYGGAGGERGFNFPDTGYQYGTSGAGGRGAVRIIWGAGRSYPSNAANV